MEGYFVWLALGVGLLLGIGLGYALAAERCTPLRERLARVEALWRAEREKNRWTEEAKDTLAQVFQLLTAKSLESAHQRLVEAARDLFGRLDQTLGGQLGKHRAELETLVTPLREALGRLEERIRELEREREGAYGALAEQLRLLMEEHGALKEAASALKAALKAEGTRGRWGELQLRRVVELAGMTEHVDFDSQVSTPRGRPDLVVHLPGGGVIPVDAKAPMSAFLEALEADDPRLRREKLREHARALRARIRELAEKAYWQAFERTPELVVVFVPSEAALQAAFEADPELFEDALEKRVLPASPVTLLALLRSVAQGWRELRLGEEARKIAEDARELISRLSTLNGHLGELGRKLSGSVEAYNRAVGSLERRLLPLANRINRSLGEGELEPPPRVDEAPRELEG